MTKDLQIADGTIETVTLGDKVKLKDGREMTVAEFATFGKVKLTDDTGAVAFAKPTDIIEIIKEVALTIEEVKTFWAHFKNTAVYAFIVSLFKKKTNA